MKGRGRDLHKGALRQDGQTQGQQREQPVFGDVQVHRMTSPDWVWQTQPQSL